MIWLLGWTACKLFEDENSYYDQHQEIHNTDYRDEDSQPINFLLSLIRTLSIVTLSSIIFNDLYLLLSLF